MTAGSDNNLNLQTASHCCCSGNPNSCGPWPWAERFRQEGDESVSTRAATRYKRRMLYCALVSCLGSHRFCPCPPAQCSGGSQRGLSPRGLRHVRTATYPLNACVLTPSTCRRCEDTAFYLRRRRCFSCSVTAPPLDTRRPSVIAAARAVHKLAVRQLQQTHRTSCQRT